MSADPINALVEKLCTGDAAAAEQVFRTYEPYLRMVVRRQLPARLRTKFDSADVVQSVWVDLVAGFRNAEWQFRDAAHLRAFLVKVTRNRFLDRLRHHRQAMERERPLTEGDGDTSDLRQERPSAMIQADDLWERLLALCPPAHHELLHWKRQGLSLEEIAARAEMHPSSVRRIIYDLARRLNEAELPQPLPPA